MKKNILIWDGFIRSFHWLQLIALAGLWYTGEQGLLNLHFLIAYFLLALLLTRIIWGFMGSETAKFSHFISSPKSILSYFKQTDEQHREIVGHNPAGGYMVVLLMTLILIQLLTGLFATDDVFTEGPLMSLVSYDISLLITKIHHLNFNLILLFSGMHVMAVVIYQLKKHNLIMPMITGRKEIELEGNQKSPKIKPSLLAVGIFCVVSVVIYFLFIEDLLTYWL